MTCFDTLFPLFLAASYLDVVVYIRIGIEADFKSAYMCELLINWFFAYIFF